MGKNEETNASKGGKARAAKLSPEERSQISKMAALARWDGQPTILPRATHAGVLELGGISCCVLEDGRRVLSTRGVTRAFGAAKTGSDTVGTGAPKLPPFLASEAIKPYINDELMARLRTPIIFKPKTGRTAFGYEATLLPDIVGVVIDAKNGGALRANQQHLGKAADVLSRGLMKVGIIALVDEATGYEADKTRDELQKILAAYVVEEMRPWIQVFPHEFFRQVYRLYGWKFKEGNCKRPSYVGKLINDWIYARLPPNVLPELRRRNPADEGRRRHRHHQFLTEDTGVAHLDSQIAAVTALLRASAGDRPLFERLLVNAFPKKGDQIKMAIDSPPGDE